MNVVIVHTDFRIYWPVRLAALTNYLKSRGILLEIIEISGAGSPYFFSGNSVDTPVNWYCLFPNEKMEKISPVIAKSAVKEKLDELSPDVVISGPIAFPSGAAAVMWTVENGRKLIIFDDARLVDVPRSWFVDFIKRKIYACVDSVFCPTADWIDTFRHFGFNEDQIFFGVDVVDNDFWNRDTNDASGYLDVPGYFLAIGRQVPKKNFVFLLNAYTKYVRSTVDPVRLVMVGDGFENSLLKTFVKDYGIGNMVDFHTYLSQEELRRLYHNASWFILSSLYGETWGLVINEAMASGLPVIVSNQAGCTSTLVKEGVNGFAFSPDDVEELVVLLLKTGSMGKQQRMVMGMKSVDIISEWGLERFCAGAYDAIQYVANQKKRKPDLIGRIIINLWKGRYRPI